MTSIAEDYWDRNVGKHREPFAHWESPDPIQKSLSQVVTGDRDLPPPLWFMQKHGPFAAVADLGCGDGILTEYLAVKYPKMKVTGFDFSKGSLEISRKRCANLMNASFQRIDLNSEVLEPSSFNAILTNGSMHHIEKLDHCFASMAAALTEDGYLWLNDYVGPARFQWSDTHMRLADELLSTVRAEWRIRERVVRCDAEALREMDPSEAIAPHQIEDALYAHFEVVATFDRGGTLLAPIFGSGCLSSAMAESEQGLQELQRLFDTERALIRGGVVKSTHRQYVARPR
jgi:SAM-dependent methyltransferase